MSSDEESILQIPLQILENKWPFSLQTPVRSPSTVLSVLLHSILMSQAILPIPAQTRQRLLDYHYLQH